MPRTTSLRQLYNPNVNMSGSGTIKKLRTQKQVREMQIPIYTCPSDLPQLLLLPVSGPDDGNVRYRTGSYRGNAGSQCDHRPLDLVSRRGYRGTSDSDDLARAVARRRQERHRSWRTLLLPSKEEILRSDCTPSR